MRATSIGPFAASFLATHRTARVSAAFARSFHLEADGACMCVVAPDLGDGALNAVVAAYPGEAQRLRVGALCAIDADSVLIDGNGLVEVGSAAPWSPAPASRRAGWKAAADALLSAALRATPQEGAFRVAHDPSFAPASMAARALVAPTRAFAAWMAKPTDDAPLPVVALVGLGTGLTPAGDDLLGGAMIALRWRGSDETARRVGDMVEALGGDATTTLSRSMLRAAAAGVGGAALHDVLAALGDADAHRAVALIDRIDRIGHTSGWDALAGALMALRDDG